MNPLLKKSTIELFRRPVLNRLLCWKGCASVPRIALTFDDGPHARRTPEVLDCLAAHGVHATFFVLGANVEGYRELFQRIVDEGHEIGVHGHDHTDHDLPGQSRRTQEILASFGVKAHLFRPPRGHLDARTSLWMLRHGWSTILWSFDTRDSMREDGKVRSSDHPRYGDLAAGDIVLMHDDNLVCTCELPELIRAARGNGLEPGTVSELLGYPAATAH